MMTQFSLNAQMPNNPIQRSDFINCHRVKSKVRLQQFNRLLFDSIASDSQYMQDQSTPLSSIIETIHKILKDHPTPKILSEKIFKTELTLLQLTKRPITHTYLCDYNTSIQVQYKTEKSKPLEQYDLNPFNRVMTHHYLMNQDNGEKNFLTFNCSDQVLRETYPGFNQNENSLLQKSYSGMFPSQNKSTSSILQELPQDYQPSPYEPLWYFSRNIFDYFLKMRESLTVTDPFEKIKIVQWKLKVVNISKSNWYTFIIEVYKFKFLNQKIEIGQIIRTKDSDYPSQMFQLKNISSIVYDRQLQTILQEMRLQDIKAMFDNEIDNDDQEISMCYHIRATQTTHKLPKLSQFVTLDKLGQVLKFNSKLPVHFVPIGELEGVCSFPQPINLKKQQKTQQQRQITTFSMRGLFEILNKQVIQSQRISKKKKQRRYQQMKRLNENSPFADNLNKLVSRRLQSSLNRNQQMIEEGQVSDDQDQQIESSDIWSESIPQNQKRGRKNQNNAAEYSEILHKHSQKGSNEDSDDEEQEEQNEYFRRYREVVQKQLTQQKRVQSKGTVQKEKQAPEQNEVQGTISREIEVTEGINKMVQEQGQLIL